LFSIVSQIANHWSLKSLNLRRWSLTNSPSPILKLYNWFLKTEDPGHVRNPIQGFQSAPCTSQSICSWDEQNNFIYHEHPKNCQHFPVLFMKGLSILCAFSKTQFFSMGNIPWFPDHRSILDFRFSKSIIFVINLMYIWKNNALTTSNLKKCFFN